MFDANMFVYIRCFCYVLYVMIWIAMYGLSCISLDKSHPSENAYAIHICRSISGAKISKLTPTEIDYLYFIYVPRNEFRSGRDGFHAASATFISPHMHDTR